VAGSLRQLNKACDRCGGVVPYWSDCCDRCGRVVDPPGRLRMWGTVYLLLGLGICGGIGWLMFVLAGIMSRSGDPNASQRFTGTIYHAIAIFGVLWIVMLVGFTLIWGGVSQIRHGRRNRKVVRLAFFWYLLISLTSFAFQAHDLLRGFLSLLHR
jgi:hypothetical protein